MISDETVNVFLRAAVDAGAGAYISGGQGRLEVDDEQVRAGLSAALVASGYRREVDVLREAADRIDPGPVSTRRPALNDLDDMQMTCDRGVAARLRTWADVRERDRATALEQAQPLPVAGGLVCRHGWVVTDRVVDCPPNCDGLPPANPITEESSRG